MKICCFGASITWGAFDTEMGGWVERLKVHFFNPDTGVRVYNCGVSGDKVKDVATRFDAEATSRKPDKIIISVGINDGVNQENPTGTPAEEFRNTYNELLDKAQSFTKDILIVGLTNAAKEETEFGHKNSEIRRINEMTKSIAQKRGIPFLHLFGLLTTEDFYKDGLHPNASGHKKIFEKVLENL